MEPYRVTSDKPQRPPPPQRGNSSPTIPTITPAKQFPVDVMPLDVRQIRWFYREPGKYWAPFSGYDSIILEEAFNQPAVMAESLSTVSREVEVMGSMYVVDLRGSEGLLKPLYWNNDPLVVMRGAWFEVSGDKWYPVECADAAIIEEAHCRRDWREKARADMELTSWAAGQRSVEERKGSQPQNEVVLHQVTLNGYEVVWISDKVIYKVRQDIASKLLNRVGEKLGRGQLATTKLVRGYKEPSSREDGLPPIKHLVFVVHGIGQNMEPSAIIKSSSDLRETCSQVAKKHFPDQWKCGRVEFIPVDWRTWLSLDKGVVDSITLHAVKPLRNVINDSVLDVMFYMSPIYGKEVLDGLRWQLHKRYDEFMSRNPTFLSRGGTVSLFAHSLGSVLCYQLMHDACHTHSNKAMENCIPRRVRSEPSSTDDGTDGVTASGIDEQFEQLQRLRIQVAELEAQLHSSTIDRGLKFPVDHFFAVGSPLALFIMLNDLETKKDHRGAESFLPYGICKRIHNVHHPSDPVAYRLEPLINPLYAKVKPVKIGSAGSKPSQKAKEMAEGPQPEPAPSPPSSFWGIASSMAKNFIGSSSVSNDSAKPVPDKLCDDDSKLCKKDKLKERLDFMLREGVVESSYINMLTSHMSYWSNPDCSMYLLLQMYAYKDHRTISISKT